MTDHLRTDRVSIGEGFAYFRWHCLAFPASACRGVSDTRPGMGEDGCMFIWRKSRRG